MQKQRCRVWFHALVTVALAALGGCGSNSPGGPCDGAASCGADAARDATLDALVADADRADSATRFDGGPLDAPGPDGTGGDAGSDGAVPPADGGVVECPAYRALCDGRCIPTSVDPRNCGGCGVTCAPEQVCSGGGCASTCLPGLTGCAGSCVDLQSDSRNCGACGTVCPDRMGCVAGRCERAVVIAPDDIMCTGGGPPVVVGGVGAGGTVCTGAIAEVAFRWALCSCRSLEMSARLLTDGFDSTRGPYMPGGPGGAVGVNDRFNNSSVSQINGALWTASPGGLNTNAPQSVQLELHTAGPLTSSNTWSIGDEAYVNGAVSTTSMITIAGDLHLPPAAAVASGVSYRRIRREAVTVTPPCDCRPEELVPIASIVSHHATANDDATIGLDASALEAVNFYPLRLDLPCGRYYFTRIQGTSPVTIVAHGHTAIFVGGDIAMSAPLTISLDPTATLDIFVAGTLRTTSPISIGSPNYPALTRLYIGAASGFQVSNVANLAANFYVPNGVVRASSPLEVYGSVFAGDFNTSNTVSVHYDRQILRAGDACTPGRPRPGSDAGTDAGSPPACSTCRDCGNNACIGGTCGPCRTNADCCAPLECFDGVCYDVPG